MMVTRKATRIPWMIRPSTLADERDINQLFQHSWGELLMDYYEHDVLVAELQSLELSRHEELLTSATFYVVHHPDTQALVGCGGWSMTKPLDTITSYAHLRQFCTHPQFQRQGIAKRIWERCQSDISKCCGADSIVGVLSTFPAKSFYERLGFTLVRELDVPINEENEVFPCFFMLLEPYAS